MKRPCLYIPVVPEGRKRIASAAQHCKRASIPEAAKADLVRVRVRVRVGARVRVRVRVTARP